MQKKSQKQQILSHLRRGRPITQWTASYKYGCLRLSERIRELQKDGWLVRKQWTKTPGGQRVMEYRMGRNNEGQFFRCLPG